MGNLSERGRNRGETAVVCGYIATFIFATQLLFVGAAAAQLPVPTDCQADAQGANDEPGQKDLTQFCAELGDSVPYELHTKFNFDETTIPGGNTNDGCVLFDTDSDGNANLAVCVTTREGEDAGERGRDVGEAMGTGVSGSRSRETEWI